MAQPHDFLKAAKPYLLKTLLKTFAAAKSFFYVVTSLALIGFGVGSGKASIDHILLPDSGLDHHIKRVTAAQLQDLISERSGALLMLAVAALLVWGGCVLIKAWGKNSNLSGK